jgi:hypothetical protein
MKKNTLTKNVKTATNSLITVSRELNWSGGIKERRLPTSKALAVLRHSKRDIFAVCGD